MLRSPALPIALGGMIALAAGMGLGRFLYTPVLPMMAGGSGLTPAAWGAIASANFAGYLAGALLASLPGLTRHAWLLLAASLALSAVTGAAMTQTTAWEMWSILRFLSGLASAFILVFASALVTSWLRARGQVGLSPVHFAGVGAGILISALIASPLVVAGEDWATVWQIGAGVTVVAMIAALLLIPRHVAEAPVAEAGEQRAKGVWRLVASYGCLGFGYIITATFIVQILRESGSGRGGEALVWALVGLCAMPSIALWSRAGQRFGIIRVYQAALLVEAFGVALSVLGSFAAMLVAAVLLGGTFMALTALGFQEATRRVGGDGRAVMGLMTASFGTGQMLGPLMAGWLREATGSYALPSLIAALVLAAGTVLVQPLSKER